MSKGIVVFGANGCGKTTIGRKLASVMNFKHLDVEDYYFEKSDIYYKSPRTKDDVTHMMLTDIKKYGSFVLSCVTGDYGVKIVSMYKLAVLLSAPVNLRMERIQKRVVEKHGELITTDDVLKKNTEAFIEFARKRDLSAIDQWANTLTCPIIRLDATKPISENTKEITTAYSQL